MEALGMKAAFDEITAESNEKQARSIKISAHPSPACRSLRTSTTLRAADQGGAGVRYAERAMPY
jgi:hypothetical protein